jgi:hypothetical protein
VATFIELVYGMLPWFRCMHDVPSTIAWVRVRYIKSHKNYFKG